ncbi:hypothetical protein CRUP_034571 [Coryphaenoides rupestris]|nr:hypothetical protein CRUP_034571 [Coryphaenoides rupestris]
MTLSIPFTLSGLRQYPTSSPPISVLTQPGCSRTKRMPSCCSSTALQVVSMFSAACSQKRRAVKEEAKPLMFSTAAFLQDIPTVLLARAAARRRGSSSWRADPRPRSHSQGCLREAVALILQLLLFTSSRVMKSLASSDTSRNSSSSKFHWQARMLLRSITDLPDEQNRVELAQRRVLIDDAVEEFPPVHAEGQRPEEFSKHLWTWPKRPLEVREERVGPGTSGRTRGASEGPDCTSSTSVLLSTTGSASTSTSTSTSDSPDSLDTSSSSSSPALSLLSSPSSSSEGAAGCVCGSERMERTA